MLKNCPSIIIYLFIYPLLTSTSTVRFIGNIVLHFMRLSFGKSEKNCFKLLYKYTFSRRPSFHKVDRYNTVTKNLYYTQLHNFNRTPVKAMAYIFEPTTLSNAVFRELWSFNRKKIKLFYCNKVNLLFFSIFFFFLFNSLVS